MGLWSAIADSSGRTYWHALLLGSPLARWRLSQAGHALTAMEEEWSRYSAWRINGGFAGVRGVEVWLVPVKWWHRWKCRLSRLRLWMRYGPTEHRKMMTVPDWFDLAPSAPIRGASVLQGERIVTVRVCACGAVRWWQEEPALRFGVLDELATWGPEDG